jgi:hypothetical protein
MKAKLMFFSLFSIILFTANSQVKQLTANGKLDTAIVSAYPTGADYATWYKTGTVPASISTAPTQAQIDQSSHGAGFAKKCLVNNIVRSNDETHYFSAGPITNQTELDAAFVKLEPTLSIQWVNFQGHTVSEMVQTLDQNNVYGFMYDTAGHHRNMGTIPCVISTQGSKSYIFADARCGQPFGTETMKMLNTGQAVIVSTTPPASPAANNGNTGSGTGNGNVNLPASTGGLNFYIIAGNGNGNGSSNGGQGGQGGQGGTATANNGGIPNGNGANTGNTGFGFNIIPGSGNAAGSGYSTTTTAPAGATTGVTAGTTTTGTTVAGSGPNYTAPLNGIAAGTVITGVSNMSREVRGWLGAFGIIPNGGGFGNGGGGNFTTGGLMRNPG